MYIKSFKVIARDYRFFGGFCILWVLLVVVQEAVFLEGSNSAGNIIFQSFLALGTMQIVLLDQRPFDRNAQNTEFYKFSGFFGRSLLIQLLIMISTMTSSIALASTFLGVTNESLGFLSFLFWAGLFSGLVFSILGLSLPAKILLTNETLLDAFDQSIRVFPKHVLHQLLVGFGSVFVPVFILMFMSSLIPNAILTVVNGRPNFFGILTITITTMISIVFSVMSSVILCEFYRRTHPVQVVEEIGVDGTAEPKTE